PPRPPKAEGAIEGGENKPRRRSHRGGRGRRRSGGQGGENPAPKSEA
ncbi:NUDIX hydrolase, partial [Ruminococcaceae bacterium AF10-16]